MATDEENYINRVNTARKEGYLTSAEAQQLRQLVRERANKKGDLGPKDRDILNKSLREALNKKGVNALEQGKLPVKPPKTTTPSPSPSTTPTPTPTTETPTQSHADKTWGQFKSLYKNLKKPQDRNVIEKIFGGVGNPLNHKQKWDGFTDHKRLQIIRAIRDGNISRPEKENLLTLFGLSTTDQNKDKDKDKEKDRDKDKDKDRDKDKDKDKDGDGGGGGLPEETGDGTVGEDATESPASEKKKFKKIKFPEGGKSLVSIPEDAERIFMPNIERRISKKIERLTLNLVDFTREFIESGQDYKSIDYVPLQEVFDENDLLYFINNDPNNPISANERTKSIAAEIINGIVEELKKFLSLGDESNPYYTPRPGSNYVWYANRWFFFGGNTDALPDGDDKYTWNPQYKLWVHEDYGLPPGLAPGEDPVVLFDYAQFLELFNIEYTQDGSAVYTMDVEVEDAIIPGVVELTTQYLQLEIEDDTLDA